jgi:hypothetical protein
MFCDFGVSRQLVKNDVMTPNVDTAHCVASELLAADRTSAEKVDV